MPEIPENTSLNSPPSELTACRLCPRACQTNRAVGKRGVCGADDTLQVARAALHFWEEPPISGENGSGTVFFANCPLHCCYCQNAEISEGRVGRAISIQRLADIFLELQEQGALNINLVTASQYALQVIEAAAAARQSGMRLPIVWNSSGYEAITTIRALRGTVDAWLMDFRYASPELARRYSQAPDYPQVAEMAVAAAFEQSGSYRLNAAGHLTSGLVVRFLLLPGQLDDAVRCLNTVFEICGDQACYSLMSQYTPPAKAVPNMPELSEPVSQRDYNWLIDHALDLGISNSFMQEGTCAEASFIPPFDLTGVLQR